jgi:hypothetical protein
MPNWLLRFLALEWSGLAVALLLATVGWVGWRCESLAWHWIGGLFFLVSGLVAGGSLSITSSL